MALSLTLFFIIIFFAFCLVCKFSCENGLVFLWGAIFVIPSLILSIGIISFFNVYTLLIVTFSFFFFNNTLYRKAFISFCRKYIKQIFFLIIAYLFLIIFSETVPLKDQLYDCIRELLQILIIIETFIIANNKNFFTIHLCKTLFILILCNIVYSCVFEIVFRMNYAGVPLYVLLGMDNSDYVVDMINVQRGIIDFRLQSIFGHPISLGQYYLLIVPIFLRKHIQLSKNMRLFTVFVLSLCIVLSGTRGAIFPLFLILGLYAIKNQKNQGPRIYIFIPLLILLYVFIPLQSQRIIDKYFDSLITYVQFWDDDKQAKSEITGSSLSMRLDQISAAQHEIKDNKLCGRGRTYREYYQNKNGQLHPELLGYESFILLKLVEQGWIGLFLFVFLIIYMYKILRRERCNAYILALLFIAYFSSILMTGIRPFSFLILGMSGIVIATSNKSKNILLS